MPSFKTLNSNTFYTIAARFLAAAAGFTTSILTSRFLGPAGRGDYFFVITLATIISQFCNLGLHSSNTYFVAQTPNLANKLTANSFWVSVILGTGVSLLVLIFFLLSGIHSWHELSTLWFVVPLVPSLLFYMFGTNLLVGLDKVKYYNMAQIFSYMLIVVLTLILGLVGVQVVGFLTVYTLGWGVTAIAVLFVLRHFSSGPFGFDKEIFKQGASYSAKVYLATLLGLLVLKGNVLLLKHFCSDAIVGYFSVASQIVDGISIIPTSVALLLFPNLIRNTEHRWHETKRSALSIAGIMAVLCLLVLIFIKPFILILFGQRFYPAITILIWMLPGVFFLGIISVISQYLAAIGFPRELVLCWLTGFLLVVLLSWWLIPKMAALGAALAFSVTHGVLLIMIIGLVKFHEIKTATASSPTP